MTSAPPRAWTRLLSEVARASSAAGGSARCTSTTRRPRSAQTATATPTSATASSARTGCAAFLSAPAFSGCRVCSRPPGENREGPAREEIALAVELREQGPGSARAADGASRVAAAVDRRERVLELGPQRRRVLHAVGLAEAQRAGVPALVSMSSSTSAGPGKSSIACLSPRSRSAESAVADDAQAHRLRQRRGAPCGRVGLRCGALDLLLAIGAKRSTRLHHQQVLPASL